MKKKTIRRYLEPWFAVKFIFRHLGKKSDSRQMYEERIILVKSNNFENALKKAKKEAKRYVKYLDGCKLVADFSDTFHLFDDKIRDLTEIYSTMTSSSLSPEKYTEKYYPDELDDCQKHGLKHYWHNKDNKNSACYHCKVIKKGQLWK